MATQPEEQATTNANMQLAFQIINYGANSSGTENVIYITTDKSYNKIDLQVMLNTGSVTLTPATEIIDPNNLPPSGGGTLMYLDLTSLSLSNFSQLQFTADNWQFELFADENVVGMTPTQDVQLSAGTSGLITIHIAQLEIDKPLSSQTVQLYMSYYNVTGVTGQYSGFPVAVQNRPDDKSGNLPDAIQVSATPTTLINSYEPPRTVSNSFVLEFSPASGSPPQVPAGVDTLFTVTFVYGKDGDPFGYGALTDVHDAINISCTKGDNAEHWIVTFDKTAESPYWTLQPPNGSPIVGTGIDETVTFNFDGILTTYQPGPTAMLIAYKGVPGYQDGAYTIILNKLAHVIIDPPLTVTPNPAYFQNVGGQEQADVLVKWGANYATSLRLTQNFQTVPLQPNQTQLKVTLTSDPTNFTLTAYGQGGNANVDIMNVTAAVLPVINSFAGMPTEIYSGQQTQNVNLAWAVDTPGQVTISSSANPQQSETSSAQNVLTQAVTQPQMFTLKPNTQETVLTLTRNLVISAFNLSPQNYTLSGAMSGAAASPSEPFAALTSPSGNQVIIVDTVQYSQLTTVEVPSPSAIAFSQDGSLMVTANTGGTKVSIVRVSVEGGTPSFGSASNVDVGGAPQQLFITPDNSYIFVTVDPGGGNPGQLVALKASDNGYALDTQVTVGKAPRGLAVTPSGSRIYVANSGDDTISIIGVQGDTFTVQTPPTIENVTGSPTGLAITPDGGLLLAACESAGTVVVFNGTYPTQQTRQTLNVGKRPTGIAVAPTGAYAYVTNQGDGTLSLISCSGQQQLQASVLQQGISVGTTPLGVAVSPDGLVVLVANSTGLSVVTLQIYGSAQVQSNVMNQPTDVVAAPDGSCALVWHNAMIDIGGAGQPTGAACYTTASGGITTILGDVPIVQCVFHPNAAQHQAFAVAANGPVLYIIDMTNPISPTFTEQQITAGQVAMVALAISGDGQHLFAVSANQSLQYTLYVLGFDSTSKSWKEKQSLPLYTGTTPGLVLIEATPDASTVLIVDGANNIFKALTWNAAQQQYQIADTSIQISNPIDLTILPDGSKAFVVGRSTPSSITVITLPSLQAETLSLIQSYVNLQGLVASPDGRRLYGTDLSAGALRVFDPASLRILQTLPLATNISQAQGADGVTIAPDASRIYAVSNESGTLSIFQQVQMD